VRPCHRPEKEEGKGPERKGYSPRIQRANWCSCQNFQETSPQANCCASSTPYAPGLATTSLWRLYSLFNQFPVVVTLCIRTFSQLLVNAQRKAQEFFIFRSAHKKVLVEALTVHKNQRFFHTCYHVRKHESTGYRIQFSRDHCFW
jgi:hypothetical protein